MENTGRGGERTGEDSSFPVAEPDRSCAGGPLFSAPSSGGLVEPSGQERLGGLSDVTFEGIVVHHNNRVIDANRQFARMFGYSLEELRRLDRGLLLTPESRRQVQEHIDSGLPGPLEAVGLRKDGTRFSLEIRMRKTHLDGREVCVAACRDITEEKKLRRQLEESEQKCRYLYLNSPVAMYRTRISDGRLLDCNHALARLMGYAGREEFIADGRSCDHYAHPDQRVHLLERLKKTKRVERFEIHVKRRDGKEVWLEATAEIFPEEGYIEGNLRDITASRVLTRTEKKILPLIHEGKSNKEIAHILCKSIRTIEDHRSNIMKKLGVDNVVDLINSTSAFISDQEG